MVYNSYSSYLNFDTCGKEICLSVAFIKLLIMVLYDNIIIFMLFIFHARQLVLSDELDSPFQFRQGGNPKFPSRSVSKKGNCGTRHIFHSPPKNKANEPTLKIVGGGPVPYGAYPWTAHIESLSFDGFEHTCGGTIVSQYFVITAAHCIHGYSYREVRIKVGDFDTEVKEKSEKIFEVQNWRVHPEFQKGGTYNNDIAVIKIKPHQGHGIQFDSFVSAACLPDKTTSYTPGTWCYISGWGFTEPDQFYHSSELWAATVPIISDKVCQRPDILGPKKLKPGMMCAGYLQGEIDACNGDSGGPLVCEIDGHFTLLGVVSWGVECARRNKPGVYSNVQYYINFVDTAMAEL